MTIPPSARRALFPLLAGVAACGGSDGGPAAADRWTAQLSVEAPAVLVVGDTFRLRPVALDSAGDTIPSPAVDWLTFDNGVMTVSPTGLITVKDTGRVRITAVSGTAGAELDLFAADSACGGILRTPAWDLTAGYRYDRDIDAGSGRVVRLHQGFGYAEPLVEDTTYRSATSRGWTGHPMGTLDVADRDSASDGMLEFVGTTPEPASATFIARTSGCTYDLTFSTWLDGLLHFAIGVDTMLPGDWPIVGINAALGTPLPAAWPSGLGTAGDSVDIDVAPEDSLGGSTIPRAILVDLPLEGGVNGRHYGGLDFATARLRWGVTPAAPAATLARSRPVRVAAAPPR